MRLAIDEDGVTMAEYALLGALIAVVCVVAVTGLGWNLNETYIAICNGVATAVGAAGC